MIYEQMKQNSPFSPCRQGARSVDIFNQGAKALGAVCRAGESLRMIFFAQKANTEVYLTLAQKKC